MNNLKRGEWIREEDVKLIAAINKAITPRIDWKIISKNEYPEGRHLDQMKMRWKRLQSLCEFEEEQFRINVPKYIRHKEEAEKKEAEAYLKYLEMEYQDDFGETEEIDYSVETVEIGNSTSWDGYEDVD